MFKFYRDVIHTAESTHLGYNSVLFSIFRVRQPLLLSNFRAFSSSQKETASFSHDPLSAPPLAPPALLSVAIDLPSPDMSHEWSCVAWVRPPSPGAWFSVSIRAVAHSRALLLLQPNVIPEGRIQMSGPWRFLGALCWLMGVLVRPVFGP